MQGASQPMAELVPITNQCHAQAEAGQCSEKTDHHSLTEKNPNDLGYVRPQCLHDPDLAPLLYGHGDESAHDAKRRDDDDEKEKEKHHRSFQPNCFEILSIHVDPGLSELGNGKQRFDLLLYALRRVRIDRLYCDSMESIVQSI